MAAGCVRAAASSSPSTSRSTTTTAANCSSTSAVTSTSGWATEAPRRPEPDVPEHAHAARQAVALEDQDARARVEDRGARLAQPVALLVRFGDRQPLDRRRRPEHVGGGRLPIRRSARQAQELRLEPLRGLLGLRPEPSVGARRKPRAAGARLLARTRLLHHRRLRLPRLGGTGGARTLLLRR